MLIANGDGTFITGPLDVWCILQDTNTKRFHPAFFEEKPMPGPVQPFDQVDNVRLMSKMHHTSGFETIEEALALLKKHRESINVDDANVSENPILWDGTVGIVWMFRNWRKHGTTFQAITQPSIT